MVSLAVPTLNILLDRKRFRYLDLASASCLPEERLASNTGALDVHS
jgi:hypothetical protein